jgi:molybdenum cofactor biosynthesis enzyme MoaA
MKYCPDANVFVGDDPVVLGQIPHVMWHLTDVCPLNCPYCFAPKTAKELDSSRIEKIVELLVKLGVQKVDISGGEPLAYSALSTVCHNLWKVGIHCTVTTSGVGMEKNRRFLVENASRFSRIIISLDASNLNHDILRRFQGAWDKALGLINSFDYHLRRDRLRINTVVTAPYLENQWGNELASVLCTLKPREWCLIQPHPANEKSEFSSYSVSLSEFMDEVTHVKDGVKDIDILTRTNSLYSTYWNIQPSGELRQHTAEKDDAIGVSLIDLDFDAINKFVILTNTKVPTMENEKHGN